MVDMSEKSLDNTGKKTVKGVIEAAIEGFFGILADIF